MLTFAEFLSFITELLGADHDVVTAAAGFDHDETTTVDAWLASLESVEQIEGVADALRAAGQSDDVATADLATIVDACAYLGAWVENVEATAAAEEEQRAELLAQLSAAGAGDGDDGGSDDGDGDDPAGDGEDDDADDGDDPDGDEEGDPDEGAQATVRPSAQQIASAQRRRNTGRRQAAAVPGAGDTPGTTAPTVTLLRSGDGYEAGRQLPLGASADGDESFEAAFAAIADRIKGYGRGDNEPVQIGRIAWSYPDERQLTDNPAENSRKIGAVIAEHRRQMTNLRGGEARRKALTAAGGLCAPLTPYYPLQSVGDDGRPVRAFLPSFGANNRGGLIFQPPPNYAAGDYDGGVTVWTVANDADPGSDGPATKPCLEIDCNENQTAEIYGIPRCLSVKNFRAATYPEQVENYLQGLRRVQAATAETELINKIDFTSFHKLEHGSISLTRDLLNLVERTTTEQRDRQRMALEDPIDILLPHWIPNAMRADLRLEMPGGPEDRLATMRSYIDMLFGVMNVRIGYFRDTQNFGVEADDGAAFQPWPQVFTFYQFIPGSWLFFELPQIDLGVVRDSVQNETNAYSIWAETIEGLAYIGIPGESFAITLSTCINGGTVGTYDPADICLAS